ncbi:LysR family transcriptional regulator [Variovorax sp. J22R133]|uniref:LysR family transcriptional regulator n=1 Tax=Variovorax brevis TaxID=3053503 RepID=UPI002577EE02|nr:LysR family transcriptional regulator [Variovorax sp. J22R133]MDM0111017.1 LysR family transcriptional regulator [Variovorax sp. J22R133]
MDRIDAMRLFIRIVDLGSFTAAAEELDMPRSNVTYAVQHLEKRLGARLLNRSTRHVSATPEGLTYYERCRRVLEEVEHAESLLGDAALQPRGRLRVDLQEGLAAALVFPHLGDFCRRYPGIELVIGTGDRLVDLVREGVDCVLRGGTPQDSGLVARRVAELPVVTCASRHYIAAHGTPLTIDQMREHQAVNFLSTSTGRAAQFEFVVNGKLRTIGMRGQVCVTSAQAYRACCLQGLGFIQSPRFGIAPLLDSGELVEVLADTPPPPMPVLVMFPTQRQMMPRVRVFIDWLVERTRELPGAQQARRA